MANENFCTWTDAHTFMRDCFAFSGTHLSEQRKLILLAQYLESPLELVMFSAISVAEKAMQLQPGHGADAWRDMRAARLARIDLQVAVPIGTYRADMVMEAKIDADDVEMPKVVIECDGFTFHDKTRDQAIRDRARDRYMQREGFVVARFAGDEIVEQPFACAFEVYDLVLRRVARVQRDAHPAGGWPMFKRGSQGAESGPPSLRWFDLQCVINGKPELTPEGT